MRKRRAIGALAAAALTTLSLVAVATPAYAAPAVNVTPATNANPGGQVFQVAGSGFSATANGGLGVYVAFGPDPALHPSDWFSNIGYYQTAVWVHPGGTGTTTNKNMNANGTFSFALTNADGSPLTASYGSTNCLQIQCGVVTMAAHGSTNRSQDSFRPVSFGTTISDPAAAKVGVSFSKTIAAFPGVAPYHFAVSGRPLPPGLALNPSSGVISGTPTREGVFKVKVQVTDSRSPKPAKSKTKLLFRVAPANLSIGPSSLPSGRTGVAYSTMLTASGGVGPYKFKVTSGTPPSSIKLTGKGELKGKPTGPGSSTFTVTVRDKFKFTATRTYMLSVT